MRFHKYSLAIILLLSFSIIAEAATNLPKYHPLREDREVLDRPNSVRQFSYNVNKSSREFLIDLAMVIWMEQCKVLSLC